MRALRGYAVAVRYLWQEFKVAGQFSKSWDDVEEAMTAAYRLANISPPAEIADALKTSTPRGSWRQMERVEVEPWFYHEIGRPGDTHSIFATMASLEDENIRRAVEHYGMPKVPSQTKRSRRARKHDTDGSGEPATLPSVPTE